MKYHLSNRQQKELDRGNTLFVCLPVPHYEIEGLEYAKAHLDVPPEWIRGVQTKQKAVNPLKKIGGGIAEQFGMLLNLDGYIGRAERKTESLSDDFVSLQVECFVVTLAKRMGGSRYADQWPGSVEL